MLLTVAVLAEAQQPNKVPRIGYLTTLPTALDSNRRQEIRRALQELGYVEGAEHFDAVPKRGGGYRSASRTCCRAGEA